jgi:magnesium chelatase subunit D
VTAAPGDDAAAGAGQAAWSDAVTAAAVFAVDPRGTGGVRLRGGPGAVRQAWLERLRGFLPPDASVRNVPCQVAESRLLGGLDLAATLQSGRPVAESGLLALADGGVLVLQMAERLPVASAALIAAVLDQGTVRVERDGFSLTSSSRVAVVACDEGIEADEAPPAALLDRLALWVDLESLAWRVTRAEAQQQPAAVAQQLEAARRRLAGVVVPPQVIQALCGACAALGIDSLRVPLMALRVARAAAALDQADEVQRQHAAFAARLVIAPRARTVPPSEQPDDGRQDQPPPEPPGPSDQGDDAPPPPDDDGQDGADPERDFGDVVLEAARAALPPDLLAQISQGAGRRRQAGTAGRTGVQIRSRRRGRPVGTRRGELRDGARLHVLETLRAAAPWQPLRSRGLAGVARRRGRILVRKEDFRIVRYSQRTQTTVIFVVDASGSAALNRLAEAKGAVELFLADCYVRRDQVALIAFRGRGADMLLAPTRSLARARRCLAAVPGGGGTPVASGLQAAAAMADAVRRRGDVPLVVMLTDGKANIALDGSAGRARAGDDAMAMARLLKREAVRSLLIDFSPRPQPEAQRLAEELGARYLALPRADAALVAGAVRAASLQPA